MRQVTYGATEAEKKSLVFRRSLYIVKDLKIGDLLTNDNVRAIRPGVGLPTKYLDMLLGRAVRQNVQRGKALCLSLLN